MPDFQCKQTENQTYYADIWGKSGDMFVVSATQYFISGKSAETIVMH